MRFGDWLDVTNGAFCIIYIEDDDEPVWSGLAYYVPWEFGKLYLQDNPEILEGEKPIDFRNDLGEEYDHRPGFVVSLIAREVK